GGFAKFFPQAAHVRIDGARIDDTFVAPDIVEQTIARLDAPASLHERPQKSKLKAGEVDPLSIDRNFAARPINRNRTDRQMFFLFFRISSAHYRSDTQNDFARAKRLRHIIVRAKFQTHYSIDLFALG